MTTPIESRYTRLRMLTVLGIFITIPAAICQNDPDISIVVKEQVSTLTSKFVFIHGCPPGFQAYRCKCAADRECSGAFMLGNFACFVWATQSQVDKQETIKGELYCMKSNPSIMVIPHKGAWNESKIPVKCGEGQKMIACSFIDGTSAAVGNSGEGNIDVSDDSCTPNYLTPCFNTGKCSLFPICAVRQKLGIAFALDTSASTATQEILAQQMRFFKNFMEFLITDRWFISLDLEVRAFTFDVAASLTDSYHAYLQSAVSPAHVMSNPSLWTTTFENSFATKKPEGKTNIGQLIKDVNQLATFDIMSRRPGDRLWKVLIVLSDFINKQKTPNVQEQLEALNANDWKIMNVALDTAYVERETLDEFKAMGNLTWNLADGLPSKQQLEDSIRAFISV